MYGYTDGLKGFGLYRVGREGGDRENIADADTHVHVLESGSSSNAL